jgi:hypothetical protein
MKSLILVLLSFCLLSLLTSCQKERNKYFDTKISGKVFDFYTRKPLANATVVFGKIQESDFYHAYDSATTDEQGYYEIKSEEKYLEEGWNSVYIVSAKKEGYEITFADKAFDEFDGFYKKVEGSKKNKNVNLYLRKEITLNVELIDEMPYEERTSEKFVNFYMYSIDSKGERLGYVSYPPYHKHLNPNNSWDGGKIDTHYFKHVVVPYSAYSLNIRSCILANINENCIDLKEFLYFPTSISNNVTIKY